MILKVNPSNEIRKVPDVLGIDKEDNPMAFVFQKPGRFAASIQAGSLVDGEYSVDTIKMVKATVKRIENPVQIEIDGEKRALTFEDVFRFDELSELAAWVYKEGIELYKGIDKKK